MTTETRTERHYPDLRLRPAQRKVAKARDLLGIAEGRLTRATDDLELGRQRAAEIEREGQTPVFVTDEMTMSERGLGGSRLVYRHGSPEAVAAAEKAVKAARQRLAAAEKELAVIAADATDRLESDVIAAAKALDTHWVTTRATTIGGCSYDVGEPIPAEFVSSLPWPRFEVLTTGPAALLRRVEHG